MRLIEHHININKIVRVYLRGDRSSVGRRGQHGLEVGRVDRGRREHLGRIGAGAGRRRIGVDARVDGARSGRRLVDETEAATTRVRHLRPRAHIMLLLMRLRRVLRVDRIG